MLNGVFKYVGFKPKSAGVSTPSEGDEIVMVSKKSPYKLLWKWATDVPEPPKAVKER